MKFLSFLILVLLPLAAMGDGEYCIGWYTIEGGGGQSRGGTYVLTGTIGQPDAHHADGGQYEIWGGFWVGRPLCLVNLEDFAQLAASWLDDACSADNNWCGGADLNRMEGVNIDDLTILADQWLKDCPFAWPLK